MLGVALEAVETDNDMEMELLVKRTNAELDDKPGAVVILEV